ncbi:MAG: hypothetical protein JW807_09425 [Spirochaetes bacterium]|nr:hypothetical protein [Spirochaetota bacterium]
MAYCIGQCNDEYYVCVDSVKKGDVDRMTGKTVEDCEKINEKCKAQCEE